MKQLICMIFVIIAIVAVCGCSVTRQSKTVTSIPKQRILYKGIYCSISLIIAKYNLVLWIKIK